MLTTLTHEQIASHWEVIKKEFFENMTEFPQYVLTNFLQALLSDDAYLLKFSQGDTSLGLILVAPRVVDRFWMTPQLFIHHIDFFKDLTNEELQLLISDLKDFAKSLNLFQVAVLVHSPELVGRLRQIMNLEKASYLVSGIGG